MLANTGAAQGDFLRTVNSWHNQLVLLTGAFQQLGNIVGGVLVNAFKPFIQALNSVMGAVINFAQVVSDALGAIFGWEYQVGGGAAQEYEAAAGAASDLEDATGGAAKKAKELNRYIAAWHEVNNMTTSDSGSGGGSGGGGGAGGAGGAADGGEWIQKESLWEKYTSSIDTLYELGDYIGGVLTDAMNDIDWDSVYQGARNFGTGLASFLNGLISVDLFGALGRTIAGALNTAIYAALSFGQTFDWTNLGESIASGINNFFGTFDFAASAETFNTFALGILDAIIAAIDKTDWDMIGSQIGTYLEGIDFIAIGKKVGKALWKAINAGFDIYKGMFSAAPLETSLLSILTVVKNLKQIKSITKLIGDLGTKAKSAAKLAETLARALTGNQSAVLLLSQNYPKLSSALQTTLTGFNKLQNAFKQGKGFSTLNEMITNLRNNLTGFQKIGITLGSAFAEFNMVNDAVSNLATGTGNVAANLAELAGGAAIGAAGMYAALGPAGLAMAAITGVIAALKGIDEAFDQINAEKIGKDIADAFNNPGGIPIDDVVGDFNDSIEEIGDGFETISEKASAVDNANDSIRDTWSEIEHIEVSMESGVLSVEEGTARLSELFGTLASTAATKFGSLESTLLAAFGENGAIRTAMDKLGIDTESTMQSVLQVNDNALKRIEEISNQLATMDPSNPNYYTLKQELADLMGTTDELTKSIDDFKLKVESTSIDYSGLIAEDGSLNTDALISMLNSITQAVTDANGDIEAGVANIQTALNEELNAALAVGDMESAEEIRAQLDALPQALNMLRSDINTQAESITNALQTEFIQKIEDEVVSAGERWESMSAWEKFFSGFSTKDQYVVNAINDYKTNYLDPLSNQIDAAFKQLGVDGAGFADNAAEQIISNLYTKTTTYSAEGVPITTVALRNDWEDILSNSLSTVVNDCDDDIKSVATDSADVLVKYAGQQESKISTAFKGYATYADTGFRNQINWLATNSTPGAMDAWVKNGIQSPFTSALGINSPSTVFEGYGSNTVTGFNNGISNNQWSTQGVISTWVSKIKSWFTNKVEGLGIGSPSKLFTDYGMYSVEGYNIGLEKEMPSTYSSLKSWINGIQNIVGGYKPKVDIISDINSAKLQFKPTQINPAEVTGKVQEALEYAISAGGLIDYNRLGQAVYEAQSQVAKENPLKIGDRDVFDANTRETIKFGKRTGKMPYPVY